LKEEVCRNWLRGLRLVFKRSFCVFAFGRENVWTEYFVCVVYVDDTGRSLPAWAVVLSGLLGDDWELEYRQVAV
jgi:hypothetical protein